MSKCKTQKLKKFSKLFLIWCLLTWWATFPMKISCSRFKPQLKISKFVSGIEKGKRKDKARIRLWSITDSLACLQLVMTSVLANWIKSHIATISMRTQTLTRSPKSYRKYLRKTKYCLLQGHHTPQITHKSDKWVSWTSTKEPQWHMRINRYLGTWILLLKYELQESNTKETRS